MYSPILKSAVLCLLIPAAGACAFVKTESFESGVPKYWECKGKGTFSSISDVYKHGSHSLQWNWQKGDFIKINNSIGDVERLSKAGGYSVFFRPAFGIWIYMKKPLKDSIKIKFCEDEKVTAYVNVPLNFSGWQMVCANYRFYNKAQRRNGNVVGKVTNKVNNIVITSPTGAERGEIIFDLVIYNGLVAISSSRSPRAEPYQIKLPKNIEKMKVSEKSRRDAKIIEGCLESLSEPELRPGENIEETRKRARYYIDYLNIKDDGKFLRGAPLFFFTDFSKEVFTFYTENGIKMNTKVNRFGSIVHPVLRSIINAYYYSHGPKEKEYFKQNFVLIIRYLLNQGYNRSSGFMAWRSFLAIFAMRTYMMKDALKEAGLSDEVVAYIEKNEYAGAVFSTQRKLVDMDFFAKSSLNRFRLINQMADEKIRIAAYKNASKNLSAEILTDNRPNGFKIDGSGYHHYRSYKNYMHGALINLTKTAYMLKDTEFALSMDAYNRVKKALLNTYFYSIGKDRSVPLAMQGRVPFSPRDNYFPTRIANQAMMLKYLALGRPDGKPDKELAQAYVNIQNNDDGFAQKYNLKKTASPSGVLVMPYGSIMTFRRRNFLALAAGYGKMLQGAEIRNRDNLHGFYIMTGSLDILGKDGFFGSGNQEAGWDWSRINGTTVIYYPVNILTLGKGHCRWTKFERQHMDNDFVGGLSFRGQNGCFVMRVTSGPKLETVWNKTFKADKTYFMIDDRIYALGSNIRCEDKVHPIQTNLYQKHLAKKTSPTVVDGTQISSFPVIDKALDNKKSHHLIDPVGNGYFIRQGQNVFVARKNQKSRGQLDKRDTYGDFATAWINHGISPKNASYEYVIFPYCKREEFAAFNEKSYEVLQQNESAHIIFDKVAKTYGAVLFKGQKINKLPLLKQVQRACLVMYKDGSKGNVDIAVCDPDLHLHKTDREQYSVLTPLKVTFAGKWRLQKPVDGIKIISTGINDTVIEFACINGKSFNFTLIK